jgi:hypothetical protein
MNPFRVLIALVVVATASAAAAQAPSRGALLYDTHCVACHTTQVHWRERKLVSDWASLAAETQRWQRNLGLRWSDEEVEEVVRFLNTTIYRFPNQAPKQTG